MISINFIQIFKMLLSDVQCKHTSNCMYNCTTQLNSSVHIYIHEVAIQPQCRLFAEMNLHLVL